jgi:formate dehydrogenase subunit gamma
VPRMRTDNAAAPEPLAPPPPWAAAVDRAIADHAARPGGLLPLLHAIQDVLGWVPPDAQPRIARALNVTVAEVHGVVSFYHDFRSAPPGRHVLKMCRAEACQAMGSDALAAHAEARLGVAFHQTRPDGEVTLEPVYCLGNCATAPSMLVDGRLFGRLTAERFDAIVADTVEAKR